MKPSTQRSIVERIAEYLVLAFIVVLPWQTRWIIHAGTIDGTPWEYGTWSVYASDILAVAVIIVGAAAIINRKSVRWSAAHAGMALLAVMSFFSLHFASDAGVSIFAWLRLCEVFAVAAVVSQLPLCRTRVANVVIAAGVLQSIIAFIQFITQKVWSSSVAGMAGQLPSIPGVQVVETATGERILRAYGTLPHPNMLAGFLLVALVLAFVYYSRQEPSLRRALYALSIALLSTGLWLTFSRQAIVALVIVVASIVTVAFVQQREFPKSIAAGCAFAFIPLLIFSATFPQLVTARSHAATRLESQSLNERAAYTHDATTLLRDHWVTGVGIGGYTASLHDTYPERSTWQLQPVHNVPLLVSTEVGIFGILAFLLTIIAGIAQALRKPQASAPWLAVLCALLITSFFDHYLWSLHFGILFFWSILALTLNSSKE